MHKNKVPRILKRCFSVAFLALLCFITISSLTIPSFAEINFSEFATPAPTSDQVTAVYLYNIENSLVLTEKNSDSVIYPASTVKIMTGLLACECLEDRLDERVTITTPMLAGSYGRNMQLTDGEEVYIRDLLYGFICGGYNDAATAVAVICDGSVSSFVERMNTAAEKFGMTSTFYANPTGLHEPSMVTSARDTALLAKEAYRNSLYMEICSQRSYDVPATNIHEARYFTNRNALLSGTSQVYFNGYCRGMNSGSTDEGGFCTVTVWERGGTSNICVVMGAQEPTADGVNYAYRHVNALLNWANSNFVYRTILESGVELDSQKIEMTGTSKSTSDIVSADVLSLYLPKSLDITTLTVTCRYDSLPLTAPLSKGQPVGLAVVTLGDTTLGSVPITVNDNFEENSFLVLMLKFKNYLTGRAFIASVISFVILILLYLRWISVPGKHFSIKKRHRYNPRHRHYL